MLDHARIAAHRRRLVIALLATTLVIGETTAVAASASASPPDLRALVRSASAGSVLRLRSADYTLKDFSSSDHGLTLGRVGLKGRGVGKSVIRLAPHSSTKARRISKAVGSTNPLYVVFASGGSPRLSGFTIKATPQGHLYGGLFVGRAIGARVSKVAISGVAGNSNQPPGETFALNDWSTTGSVYTGIAIHGGNAAAVDFGSNSSTDITVSRSTFTGTKYSSGMALWQTKNITLNDITLRDNRSGINFERASGAIAINRPVLSHNRKYDFQFGTDRAGGVVRINDPVLASGQRIRINAPLLYHGVTNGQKRSNIHVYMHGVDRTRALVTWL